MLCVCVFCFFFLTHTFITQGVERVYHELEDAVSHQRVVQRSTAALSLQPGLCLGKYQKGFLKANMKM